MARFGSIQLRGNGDSDSVQAGNKRIKIYRQNDDGTRSEVTQFNGSEDVQWAMELRNEEGRNLYDTSAAYRESVRDLIAASPAVMGEETLARRSAIPNDADMLQGMREDAVRQLHDRMIDAFGSNDAVGKYNLMQEVVSAEGPAWDSFNEMNQLTSQDRPHEAYLKNRKAAGEGPLQWKVAVDADKAIGPADEQLPPDGSDSIITVDKE